MKVVIVNCFETYEDRVDLLYDFFKQKNYDVTIVQSDFKHFKKTKRTEEKTDFIFIDTEPYDRNLSIKRMKSHYKFSKVAFKKVEELKPELLYVFIPPNSLTKFAGYYKKRHKNVKLIFDLIDLWPETMPIGKIKYLPPFTNWAKIRNRSLKYADLIITECDLYQTVLKDVLSDLEVETVYLAKKDIIVKSNTMICKDEIHLAYLGSINNIIDIPKIKEIIFTIAKFKSVTLHIIGDGESKENLIEAAESVGAVVNYYGKVYDVQEKQDIFDKCHFGLNIMKSTVCVGLTMKSIDYFQHGLPLLNNIQADTNEFIKQFNVGINLNDDKVIEVAEKINNLNESDFMEMRVNSRNIYLELFSITSFNKQFNKILSKLY